MAYVFYKNHMCFFLSVLKKTNTLHLYGTCGGIKTLKHNVRTTLQLAYHGCKNLTHTRKTRHVKPVFFLSRFWVSKWHPKILQWHPKFWKPRYGFSLYCDKTIWGKHVLPHMAIAADGCNVI